MIRPPIAERAAGLASAEDPTVGPEDGSPLVVVDHVSKRYLIYERPEDRLWQGLFRGRRRFYREFWALQDASFELRRGETVGIIGRNGSGKSTLLQLVCGTLEPTSGTVRVAGRLAALLELGSGFNPEFTGRENVFFNGAILGLARDQIEQRFDRIAAFADIGTFIDQPVKTYSSGMAVRLAFAVIAHVDADILVIDEALAVGDAIFTQKCLRFLRRFQEHGALLFVSHDTSAVLNLCQRALWLQAGRCERLGSAKSVVQAYMRANVEAAQAAEGVTASVPKPEVEEDGQGALSQTVAAAPPASAGDTLFDPSAQSFGALGAVIQTVVALNQAGRPTSAFVGGERITLQVLVQARQALSGAIVGFNVKDRLGQVLFGENTCRATEGAPVTIQRGETATASFTFTLPLLLTGKYSIDVAVAEGTQTQHVQHHWMFDAAVIHVLTERSVNGGLMALADTDVKLVSQQKR